MTITDWLARDEDEGHGGWRGGNVWWLAAAEEADEEEPREGQAKQGGVEDCNDG